MSATIKVKDLNFERSISREVLQQRIKELAQELESHAQDAELCFVIVLNGAMFFASDLLLNYSKACTVETIKCKSYEGLESTGNIQFELAFTKEIENKQVILIEDIVDTGNTLNFLITEIQKYNPKELKICSLLFKPEALKHNIKLDFVGFEIPNEFVIGYGLDYDGYARNYRDIYKLIS